MSDDCSCGLVRNASCEYLCSIKSSFLSQSTFMNLIGLHKVDINLSVISQCSVPDNWC